MTIKIQLSKPYIVAAVKAATYLKGKVDESQGNAAQKLSYYETAGDDDTSESLLTHDFDTALEMLKGFFVDYLVPTSQTIGDNVIYYNKAEDNIVEFVLDVSRRYNGTLTDALARLSAKYVEDYMIYQWWVKTTNFKQAEPYASSLQLDEANIRKCFILCPPSIPSTRFSTSLSANVDGEDLDGEITLEMGDEATLSYSIDDGAIDDIEAHSSSPGIVQIHRCRNRYTFTLVPVNTGLATITLFSRHNDSVTAQVDVIVTEEEGYGKY